MADFGGEMVLTLSGGTAITMRGELSVMPTGTSNEPITNQNGSVSRSATLTPRKAECTFEDGGQDWEALMRLRFNATFREDFTAVSHFFTDAFFEGEPTINRKTGEVSGLSIVTDAYRRV
ncbi:phage tail tube protein [Afifella sp. IM 167]|uniref:phage tail tube protein n=1 Tax=Afifella sp. IM 167 TaxID=2033586 RepID=UPI001CCB4178|nr:phage tail tube protein [Afifella sp. IM 167]MBZ8133226.1 hypothetical protein [Afifella sp. IM 167]